MKKGLKRKILYAIGIISCVGLFSSCTIKSNDSEIASDTSNSIISETTTNIIESNESNESSDNIVDSNNDSSNDVANNDSNNSSTEKNDSNNSSTENNESNNSSTENNESNTDTTNDSENTDNSSNDNQDTSDTIDEGYNVSFVLSNCSVTVYETKDMSSSGTITTNYVSRDGNTGNALSSGDGQINFIIVPNDGYYVDSSCINIIGTYKALKGATDTGVTNGYRITKIESELEITISAKEITDSNEDETTNDDTVITTFDIKTTYNNTEYTLSGIASVGSFTYTFENNVLTIEASEALDLTISGTYYGGIVINSTSTVDLELSNAIIYSYNDCPLYINSSDDASIKVIANTTNEIRDLRDAITDDNLISSAIYSISDLTLKGTGELYVYSANNNGIHSKDDLKCQKLTLTINVLDNALKGNDSVYILSGNYTLIARQGDGIKTSNSSISSTGKQKGTITIDDGVLNIYAACDGIDAAYDVIINNNPTINIYTDKYSTYSEEITYTSDNIYYIRSTSTAYKYSIYYYNSETQEYVWENTNTTPTYTVSSGMRTYYYFETKKPSGYDKMIIYVYSSSQNQGQDTSYYKKSSTLSINDNYDTIAYSNNSFSFTNYTTQQGNMGMGGMMDGNSDKGEYSTKGIKADNQIIINGGIITIEAYDDAIHANNDVTLENGETALGNITINGGTITVSSNDDGIHADNVLEINGGTVNVLTSYEGIEGLKIIINDGEIKVTSKDDGFNSTLSTGSYGIEINGGYIYVYAGGDGLDSNTTTQYGGILFNGGKVVVISTSGGNSCIDTEQGYTYKSGYVIAMCPQGMTSECEKVSGGISQYGKTSKMTLTSNYYLTVSNMAVIKLPSTMSNGYVIELGNTNSTISQSNTTTYTLDSNGVYWLV